MRTSPRFGSRIPILCMDINSEHSCLSRKFLEKCVGSSAINLARKVDLYVSMEKAKTANLGSFIHNEELSLPKCAQISGQEGTEEDCMVENILSLLMQFPEH